eukprot:jgi/Chrzof1/6061/Cz17g07090.t1
MVNYFVSLPVELLAQVFLFCSLPEAAALLHANQNTATAFKSVACQWAAKHNPNGSLKSLCGTGDANGVQELLDHGVNPHVEEDAALLIAADNGHKPVVEVLVSYGCNTPTCARNPLKAALEGGAANTVDLLLEFGTKHVPVCAAANRGHTDIVQLLIDSGAANASERDIALLIAASAGHSNMVALLLHRGANIHAGQQAALSLAVQNGHTDTVRLLLTRKARISQLQRHIRNPVEAAARANNTAMVQLLLSQGQMAVDSTDLDRACQVAVLRGNPHMLKLLLDVGACKANSSKLLHMAVQTGRRDVCAQMIESGAMQQVLQLLQGINQMGLMPDLLCTQINNVRGAMY